MQIRYFAHSWLSDWNHGNAHFLRGLARALVRRGHHVRLYEAVPEPSGGWSLAHLLAEPSGAASIAQFRSLFPELDVRFFLPPTEAAFPPSPLLPALPWVRDWSEELGHAELVVVHEWNPPALFALLLGLRRRFGFRLLLHDTHHRAISDPAWRRRLPLAHLDGVIAFGESLRRVYEQQEHLRYTFAFHEAADLSYFHPPASASRTDQDLVWIGNWGDDERTHALDEYLIQPIAAARLRSTVYGVRYPPAALARLRAAGVAYGGYLPNLAAPDVYAHAALTVHIPRAPYTASLDGIPTIRVFEAMACGVPLLCAPWSDAERLFQSGSDYWIAHSGKEMTALALQLLTHPKQRIELGRHAAATVTARHTCDHRAQELEDICRCLP